jgi:toxin secretion/phage lysis holin
MDNKEDRIMEWMKVKLLAAGLGGVISYLCGVADWKGLAFAVAMVLLDYATGLLAGRANEGLNSAKAVKGLYKKVGIFTLLVFGILLDGAVNRYALAGLSIDVPFNVPLCAIISFWVVITEAISVVENLDRLGVPIPGWLVKLLKKARQGVDQEETDA